MTRSYLRYARMASFGVVSNRTVGPFEPGLNIVFGKNEAGKTTLASFIEGVLFGWEEARGSRNTYKPEAAVRAGSLFFADEKDCESELSRVRNADGLKGDGRLVADIDRDTFRTMFSLNSDELRSLRNAGDVTTHLLTAGSGTGVSPAHALSQVNDQLAGYTSRAASAEHSLTRLTAERERLRLELQALGDEMDELKRLDAQFHQMEPQRTELTQRLSELNDQLERLAVCRSRIEKIDAEIALRAEGGRSRGGQGSQPRRASRALGDGAPLTLYLAFGLLFAVFLAGGVAALLYGQRASDAAFAPVGAGLLVAAFAVIAIAVALIFSAKHKAQERDDQMRESLLELEAHRLAVLERAGIPADADLDEIDFEMARRTRERAEVVEQIEEFNELYGEMRSRLGLAAQREDFADKKIAYQAVRTRLLDATQDFMRLLLARRMLEYAIAEWEIESQPAVYRQAGRLLSIMTDGAWTRVTEASDGSLMVANEDRVTRPAQKLSLGTCQQLYLSMRIALLMAADEVGQSIPVLADDILVNFDSDRRRGAARALIELASKRQVILLTCHEEVVRVLLDVQPDARVINL